MLPEVDHGVIPDTGGVGRLFQMCGHGVASDLVLTGRGRCRPTRRYAHGVVSPGRARRRARRHRPRDGREDRGVAGGHRQDGPAGARATSSEAEVRSSMADEMIYQTFIAKSDDLAELRAARAEGRDPHFTGS